MRKIIFILLLIIVGVFLLTTADVVEDRVSLKFVDRKAPQKPAQDEFIGEKITYEVKFGHFRLGEAIFNRLEDTRVAGKPMVLMTFETKVTGFYDLETIYSDPATFLPVQVTRKIDGLTVKEDIVEDYDQKNFMLTIAKVKGQERISEQKFDNKGKPIYNAVSLPFYLRRIQDLKIGWSLQAQFGETSYSIVLISTENVDTPLGTFEAYHFISQPRKFEIWVTADKRRIPVKIKDSGMFGYTLTMKAYSLEK